MTVAALSVVRAGVAGRPISALHVLNLLLLVEIALRFGDRATRYAFAWSYLTERGSLVPLIRVTMVGHFRQLSRWVLGG